jgi:hypothetical protein
MRERYRELVDKKYTDGLTEAETVELAMLSAKIDKEDAAFYTPILTQVNNRG